MRPGSPGARAAHAALLLAVLLTLSVRLPIHAVMAWNWDEFHLLAVACRWWFDPAGHSEGGGPLMWLLWPLVRAAPTTLALHRWGRVLSFLVALSSTAALAWLGHRLARTERARRWLPATLMLALALEPTWLQRGAELRAGQLTVPPIVLGVGLLLSPTRGWRMLGVLAIGLGLSLHLKGLYVLALVLAFALGAGRLLSARRAALLGFLGGLGLFSLAVVIPPLGARLAGLWGELRDPHYLRWVGFRYVWQSLERAPWLALPVLPGLALVALRRAPLRRLLTPALVLLLLGLQAARFPYFLSLLTPLWLLGFAFLLEDGEGLPRPRGARAGLSLLVLSAALIPSLRVIPRLWGTTALHQIGTLRAAEPLARRPGFDPHDMMACAPDPVGNLFSRSIATIEARGTEGWRDFGHHLRRSEPVYYIHSFRLRALDGSIRSALQRRYRHFDHNLYVAGVEARGSGHHFVELAATGRYRVDQLRGRALLEGRPLEPGQELDLTAGWQTVELDGEDAQLLLRWAVPGGWPEEPTPPGRMARRFHEW